MWPGVGSRVEALGPRLYICNDGCIAGSGTGSHYICNRSTVRHGLQRSLADGGLARGCNVIRSFLPRRSCRLLRLAVGGAADLVLLYDIVLRPFWRAPLLGEFFALVAKLKLCHWMAICVDF